jgi:DNA-binding protein Alba
LSAENIYIGSKPILNYVTALLMALQRSDVVNVMARGRAISTAVDVVEVARRSFIDNLSIDDIAIGTEKIGEENEIRNVSSICIRICKI